MSQTYAAWRFTRSGSALAEVGEIKQRSRTFANSVAQIRSGAATLVARCADDGSLERFVIAPAKHAAIAANAGVVVGANVTQCDELPDLDTAAVATARVRRGRQVGIETQAGANIAVVSEAFARSAVPGDWIAISLRKPSARQQNANRVWKQNAASHHSVDPNALIATITAGSAHKSQAASLIGAVSAAMPGFDLSITTRNVGAGAFTWACGLTGAALFGSGFAYPMPLDAPTLAAIPSILFATGSWDMWPNRRSAIKRAIKRGRFPSTAGRAAMPQRKQDGTTSEVTYPLSENTFMLGPDVAIGLLASEASGSVETTTTNLRKPPNILRSNIGPLIGEGVHLDARSLFTGVMVIGQAGWGKSVLVREIFGWVAASMARDVKMPGSTGANTTIVAYENKGEGADYYERWAEVAGLDMLRMDISDVTTPAIEMFPTEGDHVERARGFAESMKEAWSGDGSIQYASLETLTTIFTGALWLAENGIDPNNTVLSQRYQGASVVGFASALAHPSAHDPLAAYVLERADASTQLRMSSLYGDAVTKSSRMTKLDAPRNKIDVLASVDEWFDPRRPRARWQDIIASHEALVLNLGTGSDNKIVSDEALTVVSRMLSFAMANAIKTTCNGWERAGKAIYVFADELSLLAGDTGEHIEWMREKGRAYGVRLVFATQMLDQLSDGVRRATKNYGNVFWFAQNSDDVVDAAVRDLTLSGHAWSGADVANLPRYHAAARLNADGARQTPFTVKVDFYEGDPNTAWDGSDFLEAIGMKDEKPTRSAPNRAWLNRAEPQPAAEPVSVDLSKPEPALGHLPAAMPEPKPPTFDPTDPNAYGG